MHVCLRQLLRKLQIIIWPQDDGAGDGKNIIESSLDGTTYDLETGKVGGPCPCMVPGLQGHLRVHQQQQLLHRSQLV